MLKRNKVLVAFMLVAVLCMSIGFAAVVETLTFSGTVAIDASAIEEQLDSEVYFANASVTASNGTTDKATAVIDNTKDNVTLTINSGAMSKATDTVTVTVDIKNDSTVQPVTLSAITAAITDSNSSASKYFSITAATENNVTSVAAGQSVKLTVVVTLLQLPSEAINSENISVSFTATPTDK